MEIIGMIVMIIGGLIVVVGQLWMLVEIFKSGILWFIGALVIPFVSLIWLVTHWEDGGRPFLVSLGGAVLFVIGVALGGQF